MEKLTDEVTFACVKHVLEQARKKHPVWPADQVHAAAIVVEEVGELTQAALQHKYEGGSEERMVAEAWHVMAMAIRFLTRE